MLVVLYKKIDLIHDKSMAWLVQVEIHEDPRKTKGGSLGAASEGIFFC
jgi:hypothetical protein